ncbi:hypothetical protein QLX08_004058 [Tetragonisca angustula]|uniref:Uncharacterized protein n=1 Tax=Tetragonisca angustula TaxID=166442 RepID=A0AAW1A670_9HYME
MILLDEAKPSNEPVNSHGLSTDGLVFERKKRKTRIDENNRAGIKRSERTAQGFDVNQLRAIGVGKSSGLQTPACSLLAAYKALLHPRDHSKIITTEANRIREEAANTSPRTAVSYTCQRGNPSPKPKQPAAAFRISRFARCVQLSRLSNDD